MRAPMERMSKQVQRFVDVSGLRKVAQGFEWVGRAASSVLRNLVQIVPVLGTITGAATIGGMIALVKSFAEWSQNLVSTADNLGITTRDLQRFQDAARLAGGNADDMTAALKALQKLQGDFATGSASTQAIQWLNKLGVNLKDANGRFRDMADLMPEVLEKVKAIKDPYDRAAAATALLGERGNDLVSSLRRTSRSWADLFNDASRYTDLTKQQLQDLQAFSEAQGKLGVAFDHLGQQISAVLAKNLTPLIDKLAEFVTKHQADIVAAIERMSKAFASWLEGINWDKVQAGVESFIAGLKSVAGNLDTIVTVTEVLFGIWAVSKILSIANAFVQVGLAIAGITSALGTTGAGVGAVAGGAGLLGALSAVAALASLIAVGVGNAKLNKTMDEQAKEQGFEKQGGSSWNPFDKIPSFYNPKTGERLTYREMQDRLGYDPKTGMNPMAPNLGRQPGAAPPAPLGLAPPAPGEPPKQLASLPGDYSWGDYGTRANNPGNMNYASWQKASGRFAYTDPQTGGAHNMAVYNTMEEGVADTYKLLQRKQQQYGKTLAGAMHGWAENGYIGPLAKSMGLDPNAPFDIATADPKLVARMMGEQFKREGRRGSHTATEGQIIGGINLARGGAPVQVAQGGAPAAVPPPPGAPNGVVDVNITHKNPPPDAAVTARGSGQVNVPPPRVEHQQFSTI